MDIGPQEILVILLVLALPVVILVIAFFVVNARREHQAHEHKVEVAQELEHLVALRDRGELTPEEYERQKARLLDHAP